MIEITLPKPTVSAILAYLGVPARPPGLRYLNHLISAYTRTVPWESVSRIVKRSHTMDVRDCPRWPDDFWRDALEHGLGGTCFESSLAFYSLLTSLGFQGYLTVNDMHETRACHAAQVLFLDGRKYLVDITIPIHCAVHIDPERTVRRETVFHTYTLRLDGDHRYQVDRSHHPQRNMFTLVDEPVNLADYAVVVENDYLETGHFLTSVVVAKVIEGMVWRFFSDRQPYCLEGFNRQGKTLIPLTPGLEAAVLAEKFQLPLDRVTEALSSVQFAQSASRL